MIVLDVEREIDDNHYYNHDDVVDDNHCYYYYYYFSYVDNYYNHHLFVLHWLKKYFFLSCLFKKISLLLLYACIGTPRTSLINAVICNAASVRFSCDSPVIESSFCHCLSPNLGNLKGYKRI